MTPPAVGSEKQLAGQGQRRLLDEIRQRFPGLAARADRGVQAAAIRLFCVHCLGGDRGEVERCTAPWCPLYEFRLNGQWSKKPKRTAELSAKQRETLERARENRGKNAPAAPTTDICVATTANADSGTEQATHAECATHQPTGAVRR